MKHILLIIGLATSFFGTSQVEESEDTTKINLGGIEFIIVDHEQDTLQLDENGEVMENTDENYEWNYDQDPDELTYWSGFEFGPSILFNSSNTTSIGSNYLQLDPSQSFSFNFNFFEKRIPFGTDHVGIVTGLGFTNSRYGFKNNYNLMSSTGPNSDSTWGEIDTTTTYNKNQLRASYLTIPLMLHFNASKNSEKNFHVSAGVIGGVKLSSKTVQKYDILGKEWKDKHKGTYNLNPFQAIATVRAGYNDFGLFANYNLLPLFENDVTENVFPLTMGVSLHF